MMISFCIIDECAGNRHELFIRNRQSPNLGFKVYVKVNFADRLLGDRAEAFQFTNFRFCISSLL